MSEIHILPIEVSNKIAAGEVVERPCSVVKELVENAIDAGSTKIRIDIKNGGATYISVADNGKAMSSDDAFIAFLRHATSKIKDEEDLDAIYTLGFRGEALSSIGAVSKAEIFTKRKDDEIGTHVICEGGEIVASEESGMSNGTRITVQNLFYNTPARMKFLKKDTTEAGYITDIITRFVLSHPEIAFKFTKNGKDVIQSIGDGNIRNAVYAVYGKDYANALLDVDYEQDGVRVSGVIGKTILSRPNRSFQSCFVNGRYIKSPLVTHAVEEGYKNQIMIGKYPVYVLNIEINPSLIDINVHPTKLEAKFSNEKALYEAVFYGVKSALYKIPDVPKFEEEKPKAKPSSFIKEEEPKIIAKENQVVIKEAPKEVMPKATIQDFIKKEAPLRPTFSDVKEEEIHIKQEEKVVVPKEEKPEPKKEIDYGNIKIDGQIFSTYIVAERGNEVLFVDQHAAHERIKYEQLKKSLDDHELYPQILLEPLIVKASGAEMGVFEENSDFLRELGFEAEVFGESEIIIRTTPQDVEAGDADDLFLELLSEIRNSKNEIISAKKQRLTYTIACKAAIKANHNLTADEMKTLVINVLKLDGINTCPHGRPIMISITKQEFEKKFKRIV